MEHITFDCKNCGATLEIPENAVAVTCRYCKSQHKVAYSDGVLTADLVRKVEVHDKRLGKLETADELTQEAFAAIPRLAKLNKEIAEFEKDYPDCTSGKTVSTVEAFWLAFTFTGLICLFLIGGLSFPFLGQDYKKEKVRLGSAPKAVFTMVVQAVPVVLIALVPGTLIGLIASAVTYPRNKRYDAYERLITHRKALENTIERRPSHGMKGAHMLRMDALMHCHAALEVCIKRPRAIEKIVAEIAEVAAKGINPNDPQCKYNLKSLPGDFSGLQLLCWMYVIYKQIDPHKDIGFDLSEEYQEALNRTLLAPVRCRDLSKAENLSESKGNQGARCNACQSPMQAGGEICPTCGWQQSGV
jgi:DNA-directed RNA polymerase subunit RPC12/RpoP